MRRFLLPLILIAAPAGPAAADEINVRTGRSITTLTGEAFGTTFTIKIAMDMDAETITRLTRQVRDLIILLDGEMSLWDEESELSRFNRSAGGEWFAVSVGTAGVVEAAIRIRDTTGGAFDPTVKPLLSLWSFGPSERPRRVPSDEEIAAARRLAGADIEVRWVPEPALLKSEESIELDLNAIAKGYAVDVMAELIAIHRRGYLVEIGGEVRTSGTKPDGTSWRIAIEQPVVGARIADSAIDLNDAALATSGDYRNAFEVDGQRFSHTIDPRTGRPVTHSLASVSVIAADCMTADAWATALMVLGPDDGYILARRKKVAALFFVRDGATIVSRTTPGFPELIPLAPPMPDATGWMTFLLAAVVFGVAVAGMAVGVILSNRRLRGSCGGASGLKDTQGNPLCDACTTPPEECEEFRRQIAATVTKADE